MVIKNFDGDICDPEYMTPQQAQSMRELDRLRNAKAIDVPLWQEIEMMREATGGNDDLDSMLLTCAGMASTHSAPAATYVTVLGMEAEFMPLDVAHHREINGTTGQESEA